MQKNIYFSLLCILLVLQTARLSFAEKIEFNDGSIHEGAIIEKTEQLVTVKFEYGVISFHPSEIKSITPSLIMHEPPEATVQASSPSAQSPDFQMTPDKPENTELTVDTEDTEFLKFFGSEAFFRASYVKFKKMAEEEPHNYQNIYKLGIAHYYAKKYEEAISALLICIKENPHDTEAMRFLAYAHHKNGNSSAAIPLLKKRLAIRSSDNNTRRFLALCYYSVNDEENAIKEYEILLNKEPEDLFVMQRLITLYTNSGKTKRVIELEKMKKAASAKTEELD
jgi:tetratricopeptide (TPR) repeat protein